MRLGYLALPLAAVAALLVSGSARAQGVDSFYKGRTVKFIVGSTSAGDYDNWGRLVGRHIGRHIPGNPTITVENMPGGGTLVAANYLYNVAPRDGTAVAIFSRNLAAAAVLERPNIKFDPRRLGWIGSPELVNRVCAANTNARVQKAEDLFTQELIVGGAGANAVPSFLPALINNLLGTKFRVIEGYPGANEVFLAMDRGELEGICITAGTFLGPRASLLAQGKVRFLFHTEVKPMDDFPDVPSIDRFVKTDAQRQILSFVNASLEFGRPFAAAPGVPADRLAALRAGFAATMTDPEFVAEAKRLNYRVTYTSGEEMQKLTEGLYAVPPDIRKQAAALMPAED